MQTLSSLRLPAPPAAGPLAGLTAPAASLIGRLRRPVGADERAAVHAVVLEAYRWHYVVSGAQEPRFRQVLKSLVTPAQMQRILHALAPFFADA